MLLTIFAAFASAVALGAIFRRLGLPAVLGELLAGVVLGPALLGWVSLNDALRVLAQLGAVALLFSVGLETPPAAILRVGRTALAVAAAGVVLPFALGFALGARWGLPRAESLFLGAALTATSVGVTARVLAQAGALDRLESRVILGAAVIDDVLGLLVLSLVLAATGGRGLTLGAALSWAEAIAFLVVVWAAGPRLLRRYRRREGPPGRDGLGWSAALLLCLGLAVLAERLGLAAIVGAFLCGALLAGEAEERWLGPRAEALRDFLAPFFLFGAGLLFPAAAWSRPGFAGRAALLAAVAVAGKVLGCGLAALGRGPRVALRVGVGMVPRGEVGLIVAVAGLSRGLVSTETYALVVAACVGADFLGPLALAPLLRRAPR
ncbi:MAG TPA: cation:proton antiporter [Candidatus Saccharimonadales bacterium]|nr:cation:proton antiporter [Candidatus Saccharimonadales bacterium]